MELYIVYCIILRVVVLREWPASSLPNSTGSKKSRQASPFVAALTRRDDWIEAECVEK